jgi:hypothetical protein
MSFDNIYSFFADDTDPESVFVMLNGEESELVFTFCNNIKVSKRKMHYYISSFSFLYPILHNTTARYSSL